MDILTSPLPESITVCGEHYPINTDFRTWIKIEDTFSDSSISAADKVIRIFSLAFISPSIPSDVSETVSAIARFLAPFTSGKKRKAASRAASPLFSFSFDGGLIYAAFLSQYGIDLTSSHLHWWRFLSLFYSLSSCKFTEVLKVRGINLSSVRDPNQKSLIRRMKRIYRLPKTDSDISSEIGKLF